MNHIQRVFFIAALLSSSMAFGQLTEDPEDRRDQGKDPLRTQTPEGRPLPFGQRLRFGGGINGFRFGNPFSLGASPVVAYQATERLLVGVGASYTYTRYKGITNTGATVPVETYNQYGGRGFVMYEAIPSIVPNLYLHGEVETTTVQVRADQTGQRASYGLTTPLLGLTYMQPITRRFGVNLTALYNLNYNNNVSRAIYGSSPFILRLSFF